MDLKIAELLFKIIFVSIIASAASLTSHVLIMDEVDGMAGNEDRGGMQELIGIIKASKVPIICLCNDRQSAKVRSRSLELNKRLKAY